MIKLPKEALSLYYEIHNCSAKQVNWLLVTFPGSGVDFLQDSLIVIL